MKRVKANKHSLGNFFNHMSGSAVAPIIGEASFTHTGNSLVGIYAYKHRIPHRAIWTLNIKNFYFGYFHRCGLPIHKKLGRVCTLFAAWLATLSGRLFLRCAQYSLVDIYRQLWVVGSQLHFHWCA